MIILTSVSNLPTSRKLTRSDRSLSSLPSVSPMSKLLICWGVRRSGPLENPLGNVHKARLTSTELTGRGMNEVLPAGSEGNRRSRAAGPGCLSFSACRVSSFDGARVLSLQRMQIAALKFPALSFKQIAAARYCSASFAFHGCL